MSESTWDQLQELLRQINGVKKSGVTGAALDVLVEEARELWRTIPLAPPDKPHDWPADLIAVARELGFERSMLMTDQIEALDPSEAFDVISTPPPLPPKEKMEESLRLARLAKEIDEAIAASGGIGNVKVACSPQRIVLSGIAADAEARDQALLAAAKIAPGVEIEDAIDVA
jgi:hypothetical protein